MNHTRRRLLHAYRVGIFIFLLIAIRQQHAWYSAQRAGAMKQPVSVADIISLFPKADSLSEWDPTHDGQNVFNSEGEKMGHIIQTSPDSDKIQGFSGPTNSLIAFDMNRKILGIKILRSDDTREHLAEVKEDATFVGQWNGLSKTDAARKRSFHVVSGATLTSNAIADGITLRLGGEKKPRFPKEIDISEAQFFIKEAAGFKPVPKRPFIKQVVDGEGNVLGYVSRTSPHGDDMIGYQGPTDLLIVTDPEERVVGLKIRGTYDNQPYVSFLTDDEYFFNSFIGFTLEEIGQLDIVEAGFDVVSGATKTSVTATEALIHTSREISKIREPLPPDPLIKFRIRDTGTVLVTIAGLVLAFTSLRGNRKLRLGFQAVLIFYLGFVNADMLSQALLTGWAKSGVAWKIAPGLVFLSAAALIVPVFSGRQVYCTHLCPYGAAQDWLGKRLPWRLSIKGKWESILISLPVILLAWGLIIVLAYLPFSLVGLEPFDAFVFRVAGKTTIIIAVLGLIASLFVNRAYCRYGCPTGAMLKYIRLPAGASDRFGRRDWVGAAFVILAIGTIILSRTL